MAALRVGDTVNVPGGMHGVVKFIGTVDGKKGTFAGVELASEYAARGKNSGAVEGKQYFRTSVPGGGIFLPVDKAEKRMSGSSNASSTKQPSLRTASVSGSPTTPAVSRPTPKTSGMVRPSFSQSLGPSASLQQRVASPTALKPPRRESLARPTSPIRPRPASPLRKAQHPPAQTPAAGRLQTPKTRPSIGLAKSTMGAPGTAGRSGLRAPSLANGGPNKFSQSLRQSTSRTPSRMRGAPSFNTATTPLGPDDRFDEDDTILEQNEPDTTPTPTPNARNNDRASSDANAEKLEQEAQRLKEQLEERDRQLGEQANSIAEMERSLVELQSMIPESMGQGPQDEAELPKDVQGLRAQLRERNERIKALMAEFDANRADFRSTIDTLEMASTETERVYEQRVEDLLQQVQHLQERNEDVDSVAQQFKQLEELVQELEEGLEESRRAEAEARSEVEFLRGEVERGKSELRRERERAAAQATLEGGGSTGVGSNEDFEELQSTLMHKDDEIRGLKTIIQSLQGTAPESRSSYDTSSTPKANGVYQHQSKSKSTDMTEAQASSDLLQRQIHDLESLLQQKSSHEEELQEEVRQLRQSVNLSTPNKWSYPLGTSGALGLGHRKTDSQTDKHNSGGSQRTIVGQVQSPQSPGVNGHRRKDSTVPELADQYAPQTNGRGSPLKDEFGIDTEGSEEANEERRRRSAEVLRKAQAPPSVSETSTAALWCEICEESGHDILNCANMMGSSTHRQPSPQPELRTGKDAVREGLRRSNGSGHLSANYSDKPAPLRKTSTHEPPSQAPNAPLPPPPPRASSLAANSNGGGSNRSSATPAGSAQAASSTTATPTKPTLIEGTGDQAGMLAGKTSGVIDPDRWCALCERDGHESVDCPVEDAF
ncbi:hypothetical protein OHC33_001526 [Knufia fluminis]|uniref:CAP-Gly domain-containing protein n=1 Tax=Knufia fluminis TaxID=191047 RepID=A0AAN8IRG5_9EURO|nr:hypothetical protein OHC33_001526 [Knufia fluminis]